MSWQSEMTRMVRHMIADLCNPPLYADSRLQELIILAGQLVNVEVTLKQTYTMDIDQVLLHPDPTDRAAGTRDDTFINLVCLKSACILDNGDARLAAAKSIQAKDNGNYYDLRQIAEARIKLLKVGWCSLYQTAKEEFLSGSATVAGAAQVSPFRLISYGNIPVYFSSDGHEGTSYRY